MNASLQRSILFAIALLGVFAAYDIFVALFYSGGLPGEAMPSYWWLRHALLVGMSAFISSLGAWSAFRYFNRTLPGIPVTSCLALGFAIASQLALPYLLRVGGLPLAMLWCFVGAAALCGIAVALRRRDDA